MGPASLVVDRGSRVEGEVLCAVCCVLCAWYGWGCVGAKALAVESNGAKAQSLLDHSPSLFFWPGALAAHNGLLSPTPPPVN